ncbi:MAG: trimethylguanosine synthase, partial [ANME-2 cluster archaeon]|nr:trimethylguanosine synthase [ANME-2 cluster archaeon]
LADISCGIGGQTVCFADECGRVYGVDIDGERLECARRNAGVYGVDNITFIEGDALSPQVVEQVADADIIFSDPARPATEEMRQTDSLRPGIPMVLEAYRDITDSFAFEAPPQIPPERIDFDCEKEYLSVDGQLNRLTLYFGPLKSCHASAVVLKGNDVHKLESRDKVPEIGEVDEPGTYVYEPDPSVVKAGLLGELVSKSDHRPDLLNIDAKRSLLTSDTPIHSPFFKNWYIMLGRVPPDCTMLNDLLRKQHIGKAVLRFNVSPDTYWDIRNRVEQGLKGEKTVHLYEISGLIYIFEKIS